MLIEEELLVHLSVLYFARDVKNSHFGLLLYKTEIPTDAQANLSSFWLGNSLTSMDFKSGNNATVENKGRMFCEDPNDEESSIQIETDIDS